MLCDFNALLNSNDKVGGNKLGTSNDVALLGFMDHIRGSEIDFPGNAHTWDNEKVGEDMIKERLDKTVCNGVC